MGMRERGMATLVDKIPVRSRGIGEGSVMSSSASVKSHLDDAVELTCISALLSLSSPKCARSRDSSGISQEAGRPNKIAKLNNSAPNTPRGVTQPSLDPGSEIWINKWVELRRGKYQGRKAFIVGITAKKFRVRVVGVEHQLEFYPSMFKLSSGQLIEVASPGPNELQLHPALVNLSNPGTPKSVAPKSINLSREPSREQMPSDQPLPAQADASHKTPQLAAPPLAGPKLSPIAGLSEDHAESCRKSSTEDAQSDASEDLNNTKDAKGSPVQPSETHANSGSTNGSRNHSTNQGITE